MRDLIDQSIADVRMTEENTVPSPIFSLDKFIGEIREAAELAAQARGCTFTVSSVDPSLAVKANRDLLFSALGNLLQNAFKFTHAHTEVTLNAYAVGERVLIDVKDHCGGLSPDDICHAQPPPPC